MTASPDGEDSGAALAPVPRSTRPCEDHCAGLRTKGDDLRGQGDGSVAVAAGLDLCVRAPIPVGLPGVQPPCWSSRPTGLTGVPRGSSLSAGTPH